MVRVVIGERKTRRWFSVRVVIGERETRRWFSVRVVRGEGEAGSGQTHILQHQHGVQVSEQCRGRYGNSERADPPFRTTLH